MDFRWPFNENEENKLFEEMQKIENEQIIDLLKEIFSEQKDEEKEVLYDLCYHRYLRQNEEAIIEGP